MARHQSSSSHREDAARFFGLRIEGSHLQIAIATELPDGRFRLQVDSVDCPVSRCWLNDAGKELFTKALLELVDRHDIRREKLAVSLDGDFCVTRVATGTPGEVDNELEALNDRVPRYLQLGPGEKVIGSTRTRLAPNVDYAITGVVNRSLIQLIYDALRSADLEVEWVEPSLVSVARLMGEARVEGENPLMIADGTGKRWDVGIACEGRLLLDYRPASATTTDGLRDAIDGHITRLKRFCTRRRGTGTDLTRLLVCGDDEKIETALESLEGSLGVQAEPMRVPRVRGLYEIDEADRRPQFVPSVATVLPLMIDVEASSVPDLLDQVRRAPDLTLTSRMLRLYWPAVAAIFLLCVSYGLVTGQRYRHAGSVEDREEMMAQIELNRVRFGELTHRRNWMRYLAEVEDQTHEPDWNVMFGRITQTLPDTARLNRFQVEGNSTATINGTVLDEAIVFELAHQFRLLPQVSNVALQGTAPDDSVSGTQFTIQLSTVDSSRESARGAQDE